MSLNESEGRRHRTSGRIARLPGVPFVDVHAAGRPDGRFVRLPLPWVVLVVTLGVRGRWRTSAAAPWRDQPVVSLRGVFDGPSEGEDPPSGEVSYLSMPIEPWAVPRYFGIRAAEVAGAIIDARDLDSTVTELAERLAGLPIGARATAIATWLSSRWHPAARADAVAATALSQLASGAAVHEVASHLGASVRTVHALCRREVGHGPTAYRRLARFARAAQALHPEVLTEARDEWQREFADQAHAIREFRRLAGITPGRFVALKRQRPRTTFCLTHVAGAAPAP
jgi:AraC-like DNA-binding protein